MNTRALLAVVAVTLPVAAQGLASPIQPVGALQAILHNSGLQADRDGDGLVGVGATYRVRFRDGGVLYEPALGMAAPVTQHLALSQPTVTRGSTALATRAAVAPVARDRVASYARADGVEERFDVQPDGVELSWTFAARPLGEGDLVVRYAVDTSLGEPTVVDGGLTFARAYGGVHIGKVTGIDAHGKRVEGSVQWDDAGVRFALPARYVDDATYPIVLDPLFGTTIPIGSIGGAPTIPDAAYDATTDRWLVVWTRSVSIADTDALAQLVIHSTGLIVGQTIDLDPSFSGQFSFLHVANLGTFDRFGVAFTKTVTSPSTVHSVEFRTVDANTAVVGNAFTFTTSTTSPFGGCDIGAECEAPIGAAPRGFLVVFHDRAFQQIRASHVHFGLAGSMVVTLGSTVWADNATTAYSLPSISRAAPSDGNLLVVARQVTGSPPSSSAIVAAVLNTNSNVVGPTTTVASSGALDLEGPQVDGFANKWVVAYKATGGSLALPGPAARVRPIVLDAATNTLVVGSGSTFGGFTTNQAWPMAVGYSPGRTWFSYQSIGAVIGGGTVVQVRVVALDSGSCASCSDQVIAVSTTLAGVATVSTMTSGGVVNGEDALALLAIIPNISAQRLRDFGTVGTTASLGGGCGATGTVAFNHAPGIGSSGFRCSLDNIPPTTLAAIFNFSAPTSTIPCGACVWTPFSVTQVPPILAGSAFVEFPIPCLTTLLGQQFETQWTLVDGAQSPCPVFPGFALSNRTLLTIGN